MRRKYLNKVEVWKHTATDDTYGGNTLSETQLGSSWCNIKTIPIDKLTDYGLNIDQQTISISTRYRSDLDYFQEGLFFKYKSMSWIPYRIYNKDILNEEIVIIATAL